MAYAEAVGQQVVGGGGKKINVCVGYDADRSNNIWVRVESSKVQEVLAEGNKTLADVTKYHAAAVSYKRDASGAFTRDADGRLEERDLDRSQGSGGNLGEFTTRDAAIDCARTFATSIGVP